MRVAIVAIVGLTVAVAASVADPCAQPTPQEMAAAAGVKLPPRPWHSANIWWDFEKPIERFTASPDCANVRAEGDKCVVEVGAIFKCDEKQRRHNLDIE